MSVWASEHWPDGQPIHGYSSPPGKGGSLLWSCPPSRSQRRRGHQIVEQANNRTQTLADTPSSSSSRFLLRAGALALHSPSITTQRDLGPRDSPPPDSSPPSPWVIVVQLSFDPSTYDACNSLSDLSSITKLTSRRHPVDARQQEEFSMRYYLEFGKDRMNIWFALSRDGRNLFGERTNTHST
jgi:hypothetical protein